MTQTPDKLTTGRRRALTGICEALALTHLEQVKDPDALYP